MGNIALRPPFYVVSDTHWYHQRIVELQGRPQDHETMMVTRWQRVVRESDTILHLGDLFFGGDEGYERFAHEIAPRLPGRKYIILGNHDRKKYDYGDLGFTVVKPFATVYRGYKITLDHYPKLLDESRKPKVIHVHGHIHTNGYGSEATATRWGNINCSVEALDYRPHRITRLLNAEIRKRRQSQRYLNSKNRRYARR